MRDIDYLTETSSNPEAADITIRPIPQSTLLTTYPATSSMKMNEKSTNSSSVAF